MSIKTHYRINIALSVKILHLAAWDGDRLLPFSLDGGRIDGV